MIIKLFLYLFFAFSLFADANALLKDLKFKDLEFKIPTIQKESLSNQINYYSIHSTNFPIVFLEIKLYAGESATSQKGKEIPALIAGALKFGGSTNYPNEKLLSKLENLGAKLNFGVDYDSIEIKLSFLSRDQKEVMNLLKELIQKPTFHDTAIQKAKKDIIERIKRRNDNTESIIFRKNKELIYRGFINGESDSVESVKKITREDMVSFWNQTISFKKKAVMVTGYYNDADLKRQIVDIFTIPKKESLTYKDEEMSLKKLNKNFIDLKTKNIIVNKKVNQSMVLMTGLLPKHNHPDFYAIQVLNYIIGGSGFNSYMMQQIRVERGLAYSATSYASFKANHGVFYCYASTKNESLGDVYKLMSELLDTKTFDKITEEELKNAKTAINNQFVFLFTNNQRIIANSLRFDEDEMPEDFLEKYREKINSVKLEDLKRVGREYFLFNKLKTIIVAPSDYAKKKIPGETIIVTPEDKLVPN